MAMNGENVSVPKRKPFPHIKRAENTDAREFTVNVVKRDIVAEGLSQPKRKPFPHMKRAVDTDACELVVKIVDGKRVFEKV